jgi:hypothetical protein
MAGELGKNMTLEQFIDLLAEIAEKHTWFGLKGRKIKYVRPHFDTRSMDFFGVQFQCMGGDVEFFVVNENRNRDLTAWIKEWLKEGEAPSPWGETRLMPVPLEELRKLGE